ncbi:jg16556 [Pararge aegeria aegeria]|uniref:Jg16556 protein n=1 Tax=Pararge aegeria aegeria TaxID=348720 RepID=A0A8S4QXI1_9NEOP|nr:jg16556 [Pararge aegeria aegeria]
MALAGFSLQSSRANWSSFAASVDIKIDSLPESVDEENIVFYYENFIKILKDTADVHIPLKRAKRDFILSPPWWDEECTNIIHKRKDAEMSYKISMTHENFLEYQRADAKVKRVTSKKKKTGWTTFCESLDPRSPSTLVWDRMKRFRQSVSSNDPTSNNPAVWLEAFADKLAPPFVPCENIHSYPSSLSSSDPMDAPFSFSELQCALSDLKDSSPGEDGIPYSFIVKLNDKAKICFLNMLNWFLNTGIIPGPWKTQIIIPIRKPGKDPLDPNSYRPIALSSSLTKIMEHLIKNRLEWILESKGLLAKSQFGFRKGLGTTDSLGILSTDIQLALSKREYLVGVFLDISAAYDNVLLPILRQKLQQLSIPPRLTQIIFNLLSSRTILVRTHSLNLSPRVVWKGLPQGSVLSHFSTISIPSISNCQWRVFAKSCNMLMTLLFTPTAHPWMKFLLA